MDGQVPGLGAGPPGLNSSLPPGLDPSLQSAAPRSVAATGSYDGSAHGHANGSVAPPASHWQPQRYAEEFAALDPRVRNKLFDMFSKGLLKEDELEARSLVELSDFVPERGLVVLEQFEKADLSTIRNKAAFLGGVMTRLRRQDGPRMHADVQARLDAMFRTRKLRAAELDARCYSTLNELPVATAIAVLERFSAKDLTEIRNKSAYFMSNLHAVEKEMGGGGGHRSGSDNRGGRRYDDHPASRGSRHDDRRGGGYSGGYSGTVGGAAAPPPQAYAAPAAPAYPPADPYGAPPSVANTFAALGGLAQAAVPFAAAPAAAPLALAPPMRINRTNDQILAGVRVGEFHGLSTFAVFVPAAVALKLQTLWDSGVRLVSLLDDRTWEDLADLPAPESLAVIDEVAAGMDIPGANVNALFASHARRFLEKIPGRAALMGGAPAALAAPPPMYSAVAGGAPPAGGYPGYAAPHADPALQGWGAAPQGGGYAAGYSAAPGGYGAAQQHYSGDQHYDRERERDNRDGRGGRDRDRDRDRDRGGSGRRDGGGGGGYRGGAGGSGRGGPGGYGGRDRDRRDDYRDSRGRDRDYQGRGPPPGATRGVSAVGQLSETLQAKVQELLSTPGTVLHETHFDDGVVSLMVKMPEYKAMDVLNEITGSDMSAVRNIPAYLMGICKRHKAQIGMP